MNENQSKGKSRAETVTASILAVCLVVYFAFPAIVYVPAFAWYHGGSVPVRVWRRCEVLCWPALLLADRLPWYGNMIRAEFEFLATGFKVSTTFTPQDLLGVT